MFRVSLITAGMLPGNVQRMFSGREVDYNLRGKSNFKTLMAQTTVKTFVFPFVGSNFGTVFQWAYSSVQALFSSKNPLGTRFYDCMKLMTDKYVSSETT